MTTLIHHFRLVVLKNLQAQGKVLYDYLLVGQNATTYFVKLRFQRTGGILAFSKKKWRAEDVGHASEN